MKIKDEEVKDMVHRIDILVHQSGMDYATALYTVCPSKEHRIAVGRILGSRKKKPRVKKENKIVVQLELNITGGVTCRK